MAGNIITNLIYFVMEKVVIVIAVIIATLIVVSWRNTVRKPKGKSNGSVNMPEENDNNEGDQNQ